MPENFDIATRLQSLRLLVVAVSVGVLYAAESGYQRRLAVLGFAEDLVTFFPTAGFGCFSAIVTVVGASWLAKEEMQEGGFGRDEPVVVPPFPSSPVLAGIDFTLPHGYRYEHTNALESYCTVSKFGDSGIRDVHGDA